LMGLPLIIIKPEYELRLLTVLPETDDNPCFYIFATEGGMLFKAEPCEIGFLTPMPGL
jgi:hypothetical protein